MGSVSLPVVAAAGAEGVSDAAAGATAAATAASVTAAGTASFASASAALAASTTSAFTLANVGAAAGLLGTVGSAYSANRQGVAQANQDKQKARVEALNETQKQINMRQNMLKALASQNAGTMGAVGTGRGTGFGANATRQITQAQNDLMVSQANSSAQISLLDQAASNATGGGNIQAGTDVVGGLSKVAGYVGS